MDWHIAAVKAKNGESLIPPAMKRLLVEKLAKVKDTSEFVKAL